MDAMFLKANAIRSEKEVNEPLDSFTYFILTDSVNDTCILFDSSRLSLVSVYVLRVGHD